MPRLTASNLLRAISQLPKNRDYDYISAANKGKIRIEQTTAPEGPIAVSRYNPSKGEGRSQGKRGSITASQLRRYAAAFQPGIPVNIDRVLGASYNTRSVLEALLAHTPQFYVCAPGRVEYGESTLKIKKGHKHLLWVPEEPHQNGLIAFKETGLTISELPSAENIYDAIVLPQAEFDASGDELPQGLRRRHAQIQVALLQIGKQLGFRTWIARNDHGIVYNGTRIIQQDGAIARLEDVQLLAADSAAIKAALLIDCIWFKNGRLMPAVLEVEHTTGVTSGLTRMLGFKMAFPPFPTRWVICAPDEDRDHVIAECNKQQFRSLDARFFPYSAIEELLSLCRRRNIQGVSEEFLDSFMERAVKGASLNPIQ